MDHYCTGKKNGKLYSLTKISALVQHIRPGLQLLGLNMWCWWNQLSWWWSAWWGCVWTMCVVLSLCVTVWVCVSVCLPLSEVISPIRLDISAMANPSWSEAPVVLPPAIEVSAWVIYDMTLSARVVSDCAITSWFGNWVRIILAGSNLMVL